MRQTNIFKLGLAFGLGCLMIAGLTQGQTASAKTEQESAYDRVMRTKVLRCGYFTEAPFTYRNEVTGEMSGFAVELAEKIAKGLGLKLEWTEQISFATFPQDLKHRKYDAVCGSIFVMPRGGYMDYTIPYAYVPMNGYVKVTNSSFDKPFSTVDWSKTVIGGIDGEGATFAVETQLPEAQMELLPQLTGISEMLMLVETGKADIGFVLPSVFEEYNKANPGKLRQAQMDRPLTQYAVTFGVASEELAFKAMLSNMILQLAASGELGSLFDKYDPHGYFKRPVLTQN